MENQRKKELLANEYANEIYPDFSDYYNWKKIKEAYLAGYRGCQKDVEVVSNDINNELSKPWKQ